MIFFTHLALGILLGVMYLHSGTSATSPPLIFFTIVFGALIPDIDLGTSYLGRHLRPLNDFFQHRKFFHSIMFMTLLAIGLAFVLNNPDYAVAFMLGFSSHLFLDSLTPGGLYVFWPAKLSIKGRFRTGGVFDYTLFSLFVIFIVYYVYSFDINLLSLLF